MESLPKFLANPCLDVITSQIISHLDYPSVEVCSQVSQDFKIFINEDKRVWINLVKSLQKHEKLNPVWRQICESYKDLSLDIETIREFVATIDEYLRNGTEQFEDPIEYYGMMKQDFVKVDYLVEMFNQINPIAGFWLACTYGTLGIVEKIYTEDTNVNFAPESGITPLMASIVMNKMDIAEFLLDARRINILKQDANRLTAFMYACQYGRYDLVKKFIWGYGINLNAYEIDEDCKIGFRLAKNNNHLNVCGLLIEETNIRACAASATDDPTLYSDVQQVYQSFFGCFY